MLNLQNYAPFYLVYGVVRFFLRSMTPKEYFFAVLYKDVFFSHSSKQHYSYSIHSKLLSIILVRNSCLTEILNNKTKIYS
jgi:hypothetical protein